MDCTLHVSRARAVGALWATLLASCGIAAAQTELPAAGPDDEGDGFHMSVFAGASWSDNIARVSTGEVDGTIGRVGLTLDYGEKTRRLDADVDIKVAHEHYLDDNFDDQLAGGGEGRLTFGIVPERFHWFVQDNFGQINPDPFAASTPQNRENTNYFTTGPDFFVHFGTDTSLQLSGRYSDSQYEISNLDGEQLGGFASLAHRISEAGTLSLNIEGTSFEFEDSTENTPYDHQSAFARYEIRGARTELTGDAGYSAVDIEGEQFDGLLARLSLTRRMSSAATLTFAAGTEFSDSADLFRMGQDTGGIDLHPSDVVGSSDPFENRYLSLAYDFARNRTSFGLSYHHNEEKYETNSTLDRTLDTFSVRLGRQLSAVIDVRVFATLEQQEFASAEFDDEEVRLGAWLDWTLARTMSLRFQFESNDRDSSAGDTEYSENVASMYLIWSPVRRP